MAPGRLASPHSQRLRAMRTMLATAMGALLACSDSPNAPMVSVAPAGPPPTIEVSVGFEDPPLAGVLTLTPKLETRDWQYRVDVDGDGGFDHVGVLVDRIGFVYRFDEPGVYHLRIELDGPNGTTETILPIVVNDAAALRVLAVGTLPPSAGDVASWLRGIATAGDGTVYATVYGSSRTTEDLGGRLYEVDPQLLTVRRELEIGIASISVAVAPSDTLIFVTGDGDDFNLIHRGRWELLWHRYLLNGEYFVRALAGDLALTSGESAFMALVDPVMAAVRHRLQIKDTRAGGTSWTWHFDISPDGAEVATTGLGPTSSSDVSLYLLDANDLTIRRTIPLPEMWLPEVVAYHPAGDRLYVLGQDQETAGLRFLVLDHASGTRLHSQLLRRTGPRECPLPQCNTAPMAITRDGRFVVMLVDDNAFFIDTSLDLPRYRVQRGRGVAASPVEDAVFFVGGDGRLTKVAVPEVPR